MVNVLFLQKWKYLVIFILRFTLRHAALYKQSKQTKRRDWGTESSGKDDASDDYEDGEEKEGNLNMTNLELLISGFKEIH